MSESRKFHLSDVLSIVTERRVSTREMTGIYEILTYMMGDIVHTVQFPDAFRVCGLVLLAQHPQLCLVDARDVNEENCAEWLAHQVRRFGEKLEVHPPSWDQPQYHDPVEEAARMVGRERVSVMIMNDEETDDSNCN